MVNTTSVQLQHLQEITPAHEKKYLFDNYNEKQIAAIRSIQQSSHGHLADTFLEYLNSKPKFRCSYLLPKELHREILGYLDSQSLTNLGRTNQFFQDLIHTDEKFQTRTGKHREVIPLKAAIAFLEQKIEELEEWESKKITEIFKKMPFLFPYLAESNRILASLLILKMNRLPSDHHQVVYFLLAGLANLKDPWWLKKGLSENSETQVEELMQVIQIVSKIDQGQILNVAQMIQERQRLLSTKYDLSVYLSEYADWLSLTDSEGASEIRQTINYRPTDCLEEDSMYEEKDFEDRIKGILEALIREYGSYSSQFYSNFKQLIRLFERIVKKSTVENVKKFVNRLAEHPVILINFLFRIDPNFFRSHLEFTCSLIQSIKLKPLLSDHKFMMEVFEIRYRSLKAIDSFDLKKYQQQYQKSVIKLEFLKNDVTQIDHFVVHNMDEYDYGVLLIAFKIISKIDSDFAFKSVALCKLSEDKKIHIRALLAEMERRRRLKFKNIDHSFYVDATLTKIEQITCEYNEYRNEF